MLLEQGFGPHDTGPGFQGNAAEKLKHSPPLSPAEFKPDPISGECGADRRSDDQDSIQIPGPGEHAGRDQDRDGGQRDTDLLGKDHRKDDKGPHRQNSARMAILAFVLLPRTAGTAMEEAVLPALFIIRTV